MNIDISATIRLRPTRIGFLVRPTDMASVREIMRYCACLWGGSHNPIVPVFRTPPKEWRPEHSESVKGLAIARGYINFFEPDVFVESESGLLEEVGLGALREKLTLEPLVVSLKKFFESEYPRDRSDSTFGLNINDVYRHLYETEHRFQSTEKRLAVLVKPERGNGVAESIFGVFPRQRGTAYIAKGYKDVFAPEELDAGPEAWLKVFKQGAMTPLRVTRHGLDVRRYWHHDLLVYVFDPTRSTDLIDLWNLWLEPRPVVPIPHDWFESLADDVRKAIKAEYRPVRGNPHGVMHHATVEFGRSISKNRADELTKLLHGHVPAEALSVKHWRNRIWIPHTDARIHRDKRLEVTAAEKHANLEIKEGQRTTATFDALAPEFASRFGGRQHRWVNAVRVSVFGAEKIATVFPFNMSDRRWPPLRILGGDYVTVCSEGWIVSQKYKNSSETLTLLKMEDAITGSLKEMGIQAKQSEPGHIAKQMLDHLQGLWGVHLLADMETLQLLNKMAGGVRRRVSSTEITEETIEETFEQRSAPVKDWEGLLARRAQRRSLPRLQLADFTKRNLIKLGLETECPNCHSKNWHSLTSIDYSVMCERCLNRYDFPQAELRDNNQNWYYRVVGPFSVPDYGRGSYSALLTLRTINGLAGSRSEMTFSTAMNLQFDGINTEVDFVALWRQEGYDKHDPPELVIGETKSLGKGDLIKPEDLQKLKAVGQKLPGAIIVISVLREQFNDSEKKLLKQFVQWGRRLDSQGRASNPVILLTAHELLVDHLVVSKWKELGEPYKSFADYNHTRDLHSFADATQRIHLGIPSFHEWRAVEWKKRVARKQK